MLVHVDVTADDIAAGLRRKCRLCPVAIALASGIVGLADVSVDGRYVAIRFADFGELFGGRRDGYERAWRAPTPSSVGWWIEDFDRGLPVHPISFDLDFEPADPTA